MTHFDSLHTELWRASQVDEHIGFISDALSELTDEIVFFIGHKIVHVGILCENVAGFPR
jgi:hypothetical protein